MDAFYHKFIHVMSNQHTVNLGVLRLRDNVLAKVNAVRLLFKDGDVSDPVTREAMGLIEAYETTLTMIDREFPTANPINREL